MVFLSVFMAMSISVGIGLFVGNNLAPQSVEAAEAENGNNTEIINFEKGSIRYYRSNSIKNIDVNNPIDGGSFCEVKEIVKESTDANGGYTQKIKVTIQSGVKITGYILECWEATGQGYFNLDAVDTSNNSDFTNDNTNYKDVYIEYTGGLNLRGIFISFFQTPKKVEAGFLNVANRVVDWKTYDNVSSYDNKYKFDVFVGNGSYMLHKVEFGYGETENYSKFVEWDEKTNNIISGSSHKEVSGDKYSRVTISGIDAFPNFIRITYRTTNQITYMLFINSNHHSAIKLDGVSQRVFT
ncbi:MAG: hypothetical protein K2K31_02550, partial [Clostridia bacterium]|nr:hypothetical protein [Clostridia bacterium]